jgi:hypothetical protein
MEEFDVGDKELDFFLHHGIVEIERVDKIVDIEPDLFLSLVNDEFMFFVH